MNTITAEEIKRRMDSGEILNLLDVREQQERDVENIGGIHIPFGQISNFETSAIDDLKDQELIIYCRSGNRSMHACLLLEQAGFSNVTNLMGGMEAIKKLA